MGMINLVCVPFALELTLLSERHERPGGTFFKSLLQTTQLSKDTTQLDLSPPETTHILAGHI